MYIYCIASAIINIVPIFFILCALYQLALSALQTMLKQIDFIQEPFIIVPKSVCLGVWRRK